MADISIIEKYFPNLSDVQKSQFAALDALYQDWNSKINVISRKDMDNFYEHHVLHSLGIAKFTDFADGTEILDLGTGGGFPAIPLAIIFPNVTFHAIDGVGKKIKVLNAVAESIGLTNIKGEHLRAEDVKAKYDYVVSRAVMQMPDLMKLARPLLKPVASSALPVGVIALKGGDLTEELKPLGRNAMSESLTNYFDEEFFSTKSVVYVMK
ncbi:MAG: 16S rRNA (guanine(527)-N(7))-methyltransferase RsmG [Paludibacteraceae bacterium]|nr:16S rRNA (guanine(527)-N(7))-methyltransferase RsmG [Paludibacteraceae bacterium]MBQ6561634.1 16S rRNA (guanine(527)-N(7))-methyltransferase RsmG [Paludibacteraceae bacterium]MBS7362456.1 16S rRNA (guanine(527)-N(7))-methyltransferase RsmG [Paludibacteraceae bacterium]